MYKSASAGIAVAAALIVSSCGGGGSGGGSTSGFITAYCDFFKPCCAMAMLPTNGQQCRTFLSFAVAGAKYNAQEGQACLDALQAASGTADFCKGLQEPPACEKVFSGTGGGTKAPGETCSENQDCAPPAVGEVECQSAFSGTMEIRKCQVQIKGTEGQTPCAGTVDGSFTSYVSSGNDVPAQAYLCHVSDGLRCDSTTKTCVRISAIGGMCFFESDCVKMAYCASGTCAAQKPLAAVCDSGIYRGECVEGAYCSGATDTCVAQFGHGAACTTDDECKSTDCVNAMCKGNAPVDFGLSFLCGDP